MRSIFLTIALALLVVGCDNKTSSMGSCTSINDYEAGLVNGLKVAPPCDITNYGTYKDKCVGEYNSTTWTSCYGERTLPNGEKYRGGYFEGKANGKGEFLNADGTRYLGDYSRGKRNGSGKEYDANGAVVKEGQWSNGFFNGGSQQPGSPQQTGLNLQTGIEYSYYGDTSCTNSTDTVCLNINEYEQLCKKTKGMTKMAASGLTTFDNVAYHLLKNGSIDSNIVSWEGSTTYKYKCRASMTVSGIFNGSSRRVTSDGGVTTFILNNSNEVLAHSASLTKN